MGKWAELRRAQESLQVGGAPPGTQGGTFETPHGLGTGRFRPAHVFDAKQPAGFGASIKSGIADDIPTKIRVFASARFPTLPIDDAVKRYGVVGGDIVYRDEAGQLIREQSGPISNVGAAIGQAGPAAVGGTMGLLLPGGGPVTAGIGAAGGEAARKIAANTLLGEPQTSLGNLIDIGTQGLLEGGAAKLGSMFFNKVTQPSVARDISRVDDAMLRQGNARQTIANREGLPITPAEATGLPSLIGDQRQMVHNQGPAGDIMGEFLQNRENVQIPRAMESLLGDSLRPSESVGASAKAAAERAIRNAKDVRKLAADPLYSSARASGDVIDISGTVNFIDEELASAKGPVKAALKRARALMLAPRKVPATPTKPAHTVMDLDTSISGLHGTKIALDAMIEGTGTNSVGNTTRGLLKTIRDQHLLPALDTSDLYSAARATYRRESPPIDALQDSLVGRIAKIGDDKLSTFGRQIFDENVSPTQMRAARDAFRSVDPALWDEMVLTHLRKTWESVRDVGASNSAALLVNKIASSARRRNVLKEALGPDTAPRWLNVLDVFDGYRAGGQSITHFAGVGERKLQERAVAANPVLNAGDTALGALRPGSWQSMLREMTGDKYLENMAKVVTSPNAMSKLKELRKLPPSSKKARELTATALGIAGFHTVNDWLGATPPDEPPE